MARRMAGRHRAWPALLLPALAACGPGQNDPGPGGVTVGEARALDEAAEMLDSQRLPPEALSSPAAEGDGDGEGAPPDEPAR